MDKRIPKVGDTYPVWFNDKAVILAVSPYRGRYKTMFTHEITVTSNTPRGKMTLCI